MSTEDVFTDMYNWKYGKTVRQVIEVLEDRIKALEEKAKATEVVAMVDTPHWGML